MSDLQEKLLVFIRHAHRENSLRELDNGLSEKGLGQTQRLLRYFLRRQEKESWQAEDFSFFTSPKLRCVQTLEPLAKAAGVPLVIRPELTEQKRNESFGAFQQRVQAESENLLQQPAPVIFICSHGDFLPLSIYHFLGVAVNFKKAGWLEFSSYEGQFSLEQYLPSLKLFIQ